MNDSVRLQNIYLEKYRQADPVQLSNRLGIPYELGTRCFSFSFMGRQYTVGHPDMHIQCTEGRDALSLDESAMFKSLLVRFLLYATVFPANGNFRTFCELPAGEVYAEEFEERCTRRLARRYGKVLQAFEAIMEDLNAIRIHGADIAYELEFLDGLFIRFLFRRGTAETEPAAQILFSGNFPAAFSASELIEVIELCMEIFDAAEPLYAIANPYH